MQASRRGVGVIIKLGIMIGCNRIHGAHIIAQPIYRDGYIFDEGVRAQIAGLRLQNAQARLAHRPDTTLRLGSFGNEGVAAQGTRPGKQLGGIITGEFDG